MIAHDKEREPVVPDDVDTPADDELSLGSSPSLSLSPTKNGQDSTNTRLSKRPLAHPAFSDGVSDASRMTRREVGRK